ncbi:MAG: nitroreductase family protein [Bacteroidia bacterium]|nr:nitroreductase family protein [Bacteroidia bacterium]
MEAYDCIISRRSIRKYNSEPVSKEDIEQLLKAASYAPSANNYQPWQFLVITEREMLDKLSVVHPYAKMLTQAQVAIMVCGDYDIQTELGYQVVDCCAATQNILLAAHSIGLGTVWLGLYPRQERITDMRKIFNLPENITPISLVAIGHHNEEKPIPERFNKEKIHYNNW